MPRHHLVPQFVLRNFADDRHNLRAHSRDDLHKSHLSSVTNACNEVGFYRIETDHLEPGARKGHDPEHVEKLLAELEADAARIVAGLLQGRLPTAEEDVFHLALFVAAQSTRGWQFRRDINQAMTLRMRAEMRYDPKVFRSARARLRDLGEPYGERDVERFLDEVYGDSGPKLRATEPVLVQASLQHALEELTPLLLERAPGLYVFDEPALLTSDAPVVSWAPGNGRAVGMGNAKLIFMPLSRTVALVYGPKGTSRVRAGTIIRAKQINHRVADGAVRWVYQHPDDDVVATIQLPPERPKWERELVSVSEESGERHERWLHLRR